jgi:hypothetical protein
VAAARLDALENDNAADAEGGGDDDSEYEIEEGEGTGRDGTTSRAPSLLAARRGRVSLPILVGRILYTRVQTLTVPSPPSHLPQKRRGQNPEAQERQRRGSYHPGGETSQERPAVVRRRARRRGAGPRTVWDSHLPHRRGGAEHNQRAAEVLQRVRVRKSVQLRAVRDEVLLPEV